MTEHLALVAMYDSYEQATMTERKLAERDRDYYDGKQLTADEEETLKKRGQPVLVFNRVAPKLDFVLGTEMRTRADPKAYPRTPQEDGAAECATDAIRFVCDQSNWNQERSSAYENMLIEGVGAAKVRVEPDGDEMRIVVEHIPWDRLFWDPRSRYHDFRDAKFFGEVVWMDLEDALEVDQWADHHDALMQGAGDSQSSNDTHDDRPTSAVWSEVSGGRVRVKICYICYRSAETWHCATFTKGGFLQEPQESIYRDERGRPVPEILLQAAKTDRENRHYGIVRPLISPQDEINKRRSKALHLLTMRQVVAEKGAVTNPNETKQELAKPDGYVEITPGKQFQIQQNADLTQGQLMLLQDAKSEIDAQGANAALTGKDPRDQSGRAIMARQQGGATELEILFDHMRYWSLRVYRAVWQRVRQYWTHEKWIRVTDSEEHMKWVPMNRPITRAEAMQAQGQPMPPPELLMLDPAMQATMEAVVGYQNKVSELDVDIVLDESPDTIVLQQEQWEQLSQMAAAGIPIPPDVLIEASSLRNKRELLERMRGGGASPEEQQAAAAAQQQAQQYTAMAAQLELQDKASKIGKTQAETAKIKADAAATVTGARVEIDRAAREHVNESMQRMMPPMNGGMGIRG